MAAVRASAAEAEKFIEAAEASERVAVAAINGARSVVISGSEDAVSKVLGVMADASITGLRLSVKHAFHSPSMAGIVKDYEAALSDVILLGTEQQVLLAARAATDLAAGRPVHTDELVVSLRDFIRKVLDLEPVPTKLAIPKQGPKARSR